MKRLICFLFGHKYRLTHVDTHEYRVLLKRDYILCCDRCEKTFGEIDENI